MYVGAHGGAIASMYRFTPQVTQTWKHPFLGWNAGLVYRYAGHKVCGMQVEINYMQRGWYEPETDYTRQLDYIEVPFLMHLYFGKRARGFFNLGPQIGYCIYSSEKGNVPEIYDIARKAGANSKSAHQYAKIEKPFDWGLAAGLGFYYRSKYAGVYQLEARFNWSFGNLISGMVMPYWGMVGSFVGLIITFVANPILYHYGLLSDWKTGDDTVVTASRGHRSVESRAFPDSPRDRHLQRRWCRFGESGRRGF